MKVYKNVLSSTTRVVISLIATFSALFSASSAQVRDLGLDALLGAIPANSSQSWFDPATGNILRMDAYGKLNNSFSLGLPTTVDGKVTARDLGDGTERVTVLVHTRNALCWGFNSSFAPAFGYRPADVMNGVGPAAIGNITYRLVYLPQPIGQFDPLGDVEIWFGTASCAGELRAGSGYLEGTSGFAQTTQTGLLATGVPSGCPPEKDADCFPAEKIQFKATEQ